MTLEARRPEENTARAFKEYWRHPPLPQAAMAASPPPARHLPDAATGEPDPTDPTVATARSEAEEDALTLEIKRLRQELAKERRTRAALHGRFAEDLKLTEKRIKGHLSYRLGKEIVTSGRSPLAWLGLPLRLLRAYGDYRRAARAATEPRARPASARLVKLYESEGPESVTRQIARSNRRLPPAAVARELVKAGRALKAAGIEEAEVTLTAAAVKLHRSTATLRAHFWSAHRARDFDRAREVAEELYRIAEEQTLSSEERGRLERIFLHPVRQLSILQLIHPSETPGLERISGRLCYVLHNSLPHSSGGYATRSHGLARALLEAGWDVVAVSRPGFPFDVTSNLTAGEVEPVDLIDGIRYVRNFEPSRRGLAPAQYIELAAAAVENELRQQRPEVVVAASNHLTGLPALIAARRLGIPFFYEVRGLWEITRLSREPQFAQHINFWIQKSLEAAVASHAEGVFTLTEAMRAELVVRGVPPARITLLPNCCDPKQFFPRPRDRELQEQWALPEEVPVIGYVGTFVSYEGLDDLAQACGLLKKQGARFRLLLVGNEDASGSSRGRITQAIEDLARREDFLEWLIMPGRVAHEMAPRYYSLIDITPFPRKALPVCEMVSPIKPLEALAMEKAVLVSDVGALAEMVCDGETGLHFRKGDVRDLAAKLLCLLGDRGLRERLGREGRQWVERERTWSAVAQRMQNAILPPLARTPRMVADLDPETTGPNGVENG